MHRHAATVKWTGNLGEGTATYRGYSRDHEIGGANKSATIPASSMGVFRGDRTRYNPEELVVAAASACHMLWVLHLCADAGIAVTAYEDDPVGEQSEKPEQLTRIELRPRITLADASRAGELAAIHHRAHEECCIARSLRCDVVVNAGK